MTDNDVAAISDRACRPGAVWLRGDGVRRWRGRVGFGFPRSLAGSSARLGNRCSSTHRAGSAYRDSVMRGWPSISPWSCGSRARSRLQPEENPRQYVSMPGRIGRVVLAGCVVLGTACGRLSTTSISYTPQPDRITDPLITLRSLILA